MRGCEIQLFAVRELAGTPAVPGTAFVSHRIGFVALPTAASCCRRQTGASTAPKDSFPIRQHAIVIVVDAIVFEAGVPIHNERAFARPYAAGTSMNNPRNRTTVAHAPTMSLPTACAVSHAAPRAQRMACRNARIKTKT
jgi:hypothetical protein